MFTFLIVAAVLSLAQAGVRELSPQEEHEALTLWRNICASGSEQGSVYGNAQIYCKVSTDQYNENQHHNIIIPRGSDAQKQVIFVQPPSYKYNHNIEISGSPGPSQQSTIYVLPQKNTHTIQHSYNPGDSVSSKPTVHFLKNNPQQGYGSVGGFNSGVISSSSSNSGYTISTNTGGYGSVVSSIGGYNQESSLGGNSDFQQDNFPQKL